MRIKKTVLINVSLLLFSTLVALVGLEIGLRIHDKIPLSAFKNFVYEQVDFFASNAMAVYDDELGWTAKPHAALTTETADDKNVYLKSSPIKKIQSFTTGDYGVRMNAAKIIPLAKNSIVAVGDSFAFGSDVSDEESWPAYLEQMTGQPVVNASAGGWATDQIILQAKKMCELLTPHTVVMSFLTNDIDRSEYNIYSGGHKPYFEIMDGKLVRRNKPVPLPGSSIKHLGLIKQVLGYSYFVTWAMKRIGFQKQWGRGWNLLYQRATKPGDGAKITCLLLDDFKKYCDEKGIRLILIIQYGSTEHYIENTQSSDAKTVVEHAKEIGIETIDFWSVIRDIRIKSEEKFRDLYVLFPDGKTLGHMSANGNRMTAEEILAVYQKGISTAKK